MPAMPYLNSHVRRAIAYDSYTEATTCGRAGDHVACGQLRATGRDCVWDGASCDVDIMPDPSVRTQTCA